MSLETDKQGGFKFSLEGLQTGVWPDAFARQVPLWEEGENTHNRFQGIAKIDGWEEVVTTAGDGPVRGIVQNAELEGPVTVDKIYYGNLTNLYSYEDGAASVTEVGSGYSLVEFGGDTIWDDGGTTWDTASTDWDEGLNRASFWSFATFGNFVLATSGADTGQIKKGNVNFVALRSGSMTGVTITSPGSGYLVSDSLTVTGDGSDAAAEVSAIDNDGGITEIKITDGGQGYSTPPTLSGGTGSGAEFSATVASFPSSVNNIFIFLVRGPYVLGFRTDRNDKEFIWCSADDVDQWNPALDNTAGDLIIRELDSPVRAAHYLGDQVAVYSDNRMVLVSLVGGQSIFGYQPALEGIGAVSQASVTSTGKQNYGLSLQGFYVTDGVQYRYIDDAIRDFFFSDVSTDQISQTCSYHNLERQEITWWYVSTSAGDDLPDKGVTYNYRDGAWFKVNRGITYADSRNVFQYPIQGDKSGDIFFGNKTDNDNTQSITAFARTKPMDFGDASRVKSIQSIRIGWEGTGLQYRLGSSDTESGSPSYTSYINASTDFSEQWHRLTGRYITLELYSTGTNDNWEVSEIELLGRVEGTR